MSTLFTLILVAIVIWVLLAWFSVALCAAAGRVREREERWAAEAAADHGEPAADLPWFVVEHTSLRDWWLSIQADQMALHEARAAAVAAPGRGDPMSRQWEVGDLAMVLCSDGERRQAMCWESRVVGPSRAVWRFPDGWIWSTVLASDDDLSARPLLVIDPEDRAQVERLAAALFAEIGADWPDGYTANEVQAALRSLLEPEPEPEEPTTWLTEIRDGTGDHWVRVYERGAVPWVKRLRTDAVGMHLATHYAYNCAWADLPRPITILSPGYSGEDES